MSLNSRSGIREARTKREACCDDDVCFYCGGWLARSHEHDHFPIPKGSGGTDVVAACMNCHDLKDRQAFVDWPPEMIYRGVTALFTACPGLAEDWPGLSGADLVAELPGWSIMREIWPDLSTEARLCYGKFSRLSYEFLNLRRALDQ